MLRAGNHCVLHQRLSSPVGIGAAAQTGRHLTENESDLEICLAHADGWDIGPYLAVLLIVKGVVGLTRLVNPLLKMLAVNTEHHALVAFAIVVLASFVVVLAVTTWPGRPLARWLDKGLPHRILGYTFFRSLLSRTIGDSKTEFRVAFIEFDDSTALGYVVEEHPDGTFTVFFPSSPSPISGTVLLMPPSRVRIVDVPFTLVFGSMTKWGSGVRDIACMLPNKPQ